MENPLITVIIPVYMVEKYLNRCVDSVLHQTYRDLEIFLVDDGSTDNCGVICDEYAQIDERVRVIHKENGGLSDARNAALDIANGEFIVFIDSDDYVSKYYVENLYHAISKENADMAFSWFEHVFEDDQRKTIPSACIDDTLVIYNDHDCMEKLLYQDDVEASAWGKMYRRKIFCDLRYPKGKLYEDIPVTCRAIYLSEKIAVIKNVDYYYFQRKSSIQNANFNCRKMDAIAHMDDIYSFIREKYPDLVSAAKCRYFSVVCNILFQIDSDEYMTEKEILWKKIKLYRKDVLFNNKARKKARAAALLSYGGYAVIRAMYKKTQWRG